MSGRALLTTVHAMLVESHGAEAVDELLHGKRRWRETIDPSEVVWDEVG